MNTLGFSLKANLLRLYPVKWKYYPTLRVELMGCYKPYGKTINEDLGEEVGTFTIHHNILVEFQIRFHLHPHPHHNRSVMMSSQEPNLAMTSFIGMVQTALIKNFVRASSDYLCKQTGIYFNHFKPAHEVLGNITDPES